MKALIRKDSGLCRLLRVVGREPREAMPNLCQTYVTRLFLLPQQLGYLQDQTDQLPSYHYQTPYLKAGMLPLVRFSYERKNLPKA